MNKIINKFLLAGDKFIAKMYSKQLGFTYSARLSFTKNKERIEKFKINRKFNIYYSKWIDKACFQHDTVYGDFKDLNRRSIADNVLRDKAFNIAKNPKYDGYQRGLTSVVYKFFD